MHSSNVLVLRDRSPYPDRDFHGAIAVYKIPLHLRLVRDRFPEARIIECPAVGEVIRNVCTGAATAGFYEARMAQSELRETPPECSAVSLRVQAIPDLTFQAGLASTFGAAGSAEKIQRSIDRMFRDGSMAVLIAKYSYFGLDDTWASYEQIEAEERWRGLTWACAGLIFLAGVTLWLASSLRQRKRSEAALRDSEARFRNLANTAPVMIVASGPDGQATFFNTTWLDFTGRTMEQELGAGWIGGVHPDDRDRTLSEYTRSLASRGNCKMEYRLRRADGEYRHVVCSGVARFEPNGAFAGYIASCLDLTDIKSAQEEASARQNLESLGVLAGGVAHDFNNLLGGALAYAELAQTKLAEGISPEDELRQIRAVATRGSEIVRELMLFAGSERGTIEPVDVSSLVEEMLELLKVSISKHAVLQTRLAAGLPAVHGNAAQIRQVIMNLVSNASEALGNQDGIIRVVTERVVLGSVPQWPEAKTLREGSYVLLEVADTGCGMTPETQRKVFDPFFSTKFPGRGMGLAVVQKVVQWHGGAVRIVSSAGQGTSLQILLPCLAKLTLSRERKSAPRVRSVEPQAESGGTVLVVEDEHTLRAAVAILLQRRGFSVIQAADGSSALEMLRGHQDRIDAVLLDTTLPGAPSREVFEEAERLHPGILIVLTSAYSQESATSTFTGLKVAHFLRKPFRTEELVNIIRSSLSVRSSSA